MNWWQLGYDPMACHRKSAMVEACVCAYAQTIAMCPGDHWRLKHNGGRERVTTRRCAHPAAAERLSIISDFMLNATRSLYLEGNAYALGAAQ